MLSDELKFENKQKFYTLLSCLDIDLSELDKYLTAVNYFEKPATALYKGNYAGGLCEQALKLFAELGILCNAYFPDRYSKETVIKVALFAEIFKAELYEFYYKNVKSEETGQWTSVGAWCNNEQRLSYGDIGMSSFMIAKKFVTFTEEESLAIIYSGTNSIIDSHRVQEAFPLITLLKMALQVVEYFN